MLRAAYVGIMATVTADTWATEIGVLSPHPPRLITSGRVVPPGTSGGVTLYGLGASAGGAILIGAAALALMAAERGHWLPLLLPAALAGGVAGSLFDSLLGATVQAMYRSPTGETEKRASREGRAFPLVRGWRWMNNDMVNFLSSLAGGAVAAGMYAAFGGYGL